VSDFFALGGQSLLATQLLARVYDMFQVEVPLQHLLIKPTIAGLVESLETAMHQAIGFRLPPLKPVPRDQPLPLSFAQQRLWTLNQLQPGTPAYNMTSAIRLTGYLDTAMLARSIQIIVQRHESLRTSFPADVYPPQQVLVANLEIPLTRIDLRGLDAGAREEQVQQRTTAESQLPFDLARGPLLRTTLLQLDDTTNMLLLTMHHIISDAWSVGIFLRELAVSYTALCTGNEVLLPTLPLQYADFAAWLRHWVRGDYLETQLRYWQQALADAPALLGLPTDQPRPAIQSFQGAQQSFSLSVPLTTGLKRRSQQQSATLFMTLLTAFKTLLYRYSGHSDIVIGIPMTNRHRTEFEGLIGLFTDILVLRTDLAGNPSFISLLGQIRQKTLEAYEHRNVPFEKLVEIAGNRRNLSYNPLFQVMFSFEETQAEPLIGEGIRIEPLVVETGVAKFDLFLAMTQNGDGLSGTWEYNTDLFSAASMQHLLKNFATLLQAIDANPHTPIEQLSLLSMAERDEALAGASIVKKKRILADLRERFAKPLDEQGKQ
jgi:non-ribosomal peptide synthetase component F